MAGFLLANFYWAERIIPYLCCPLFWPI